MHETRVGGQELASTLASAQVSPERDGSKEQEISRRRGYHITCRPSVRIPGSWKYTSITSRHTGSQEMESRQRESQRHTRRHSKSLLQDLLSKGALAGHRDTPTPGELMRDAKTVQSIASIINGRSRLLLLESPDTVEVYKLPKAVAPPGGGRGDKPVYLPSIPVKASSLGSVRAPLSLSCPYLSSKRRASFSSTGSHRTGEYGKQSTLKALKEAKRSNVTVTMTYLGQGHPGSGSGSPADELKVLQQICGGENICVFKGLVKAGGAFSSICRPGA
ncbi:uncharacterized protein LOC124463575 [Hypomesus transpacificus]|uniref:uncharacterized protein LOC124463575 n=1 Tax=Hypomesus transpacificus TaxID=137520 RepID=UPI001F0777D4|nr:uncharacterized protein LOC124463575 [Hypomesus transpacificus]